MTATTTTPVTTGRARSGRSYRRGRGVQIALAHLLLLLIVVLSFYPVVTMVLNSFKSDSEVLRNPAGLPEVWTLASYQAIFTYHGGLWVNFLNSAFIATTSTVVSLWLASMAAFAFAKYQFKGRNLIFALLLAMMMVPFEITVPPLYILFARLGWLNTYQAMIVPGLASVFGLFLIRQYMLGIPSALLEAARMDGANHWQLYTRIMVPACAPVLGAFAILHFMGSWNDYLWPLVVATERSIQPIMVVLPNLRDPHIGFLPVWGTIMAGSVLATLPIVTIFIAFQDKFMSSVVVGAIKE